MMMIRASNLHKSYGNLRVLQDVSLDIIAGEIVAIIGPSGAGKSTLLHILGLLDKPDIGSVSILDQAVAQLSAKKQADFRNQHIGFVFQAHHLLPEFSAAENVAMPLWIAGRPKAEALAAASEVLHTVGLSHRLHHKPSELSGGEQQRVAIARAVVQRPEIVFADEPTGNLDTHTASAIHELFLELKDTYQLTFVIVTHNDVLASLATRVIQMKDGVIIADTSLTSSK